MSGQWLCICHPEGYLQIPQHSVTYGSIDMSPDKMDCTSVWNIIPKNSQLFLCKSLNDTLLKPHNPTEPLYKELPHPSNLFVDGTLKSCHWLVGWLEVPPLDGAPCVTGTGTCAGCGRLTTYLVSHLCLLPTTLVLLDYHTVVSHLCLLHYHTLCCFSHCLCYQLSYTFPHVDV